MATHDYVIANQSGAAFRTDLNNVLAAIVSNNSNSSSPATTYAYQWWADTTNGVLKIRNSANNAWIELLQLDGTLTLEDGSASTPALAFRDDLNTGIFSSTADTFNVATAGVERFRIGSNGNCAIGTTSTSNPLVIQNMSNSRVHFRAIGDISTTVAGAGLGLDVLNDNADTVMDLAMRGATTIFRNATSETMRIDTSARLLLGVTTNNVSGSDARFQVSYLKQSQFGIHIRPSDNNTGGGGPMSFQNQAGTSIGAITADASNVAYLTSSDYRLKENEVAISDGITRLKTLKPYRFNFIAEPDKTVDGFFAHEVTAVPEAISGTKDEVETTYYEEGDTIPGGKAVGDVKSTTSPVYQGIDQSKLVPLLTAALQEAITKIETLETKVASLEGS